MKNRGHYCGLFKGRNHLVLLLLPKKALIQQEIASIQNTSVDFLILKRHDPGKIPRIE